MASIELSGALVTRVDRPAPGVYALSLHPPGVLLLAAGPPRRRAAWSLVDERPRGEPADGHVRGLRERLEGARIEQVWLTREGLCLSARRGEITWRLVADGSGVSCQPGQGDEARGEPVGAGDVEAARGRGEALLAEQQRLAAEAARAEAASLLRSSRERLRRRAAAVERDLAAAAASEERAAFASLFVPAAAAARPGQAELRAVDWSTGEAREVTFALAPDRPARAQLEALFARAKRLKLGAEAVRRRRDDALLGVMQIDEALEALAGAPDAQAAQLLLRRLASELPGDARLLPPSARQGSLSTGPRPYRCYEGAGGNAIWVGRDAASNDELTLKIARPGDLWVHARGRAGAHVVVPGFREGASELLIDAATLAAHFSDARGEDLVEVQYAPRKRVRKRKGSAPGAVEVAQERVIALRASPERLSRLLATAERDAPELGGKAAPG